LYLGVFLIGKWAILVNFNTEMGDFDIEMVVFDIEMGVLGGF
jgi:hypothetical protein